MAKHIEKIDHNIQFDNSEVRIDKYGQGPVREAIEIQKNPNNFNR